jgi:transmembrane sensor
MNSNDEKIRALVAEQAGEWLVEHDAGTLDAPGAAALVSWLKASPLHIEEFIGVSAIARDLREARADPGYTLEAILARSRREEDAPAETHWPTRSGTIGGRATRHWSLATVAMAACALLGVGVTFMWFRNSGWSGAVPDAGVALNLKTRHGELLTQRLTDGTVLHLNTDSEVRVGYSRGERLVVLKSGQAGFDVAHETARAFRVQAGPAEVVDLGTRFDVRMAQDATVVTVVEGHVAVRPGGPSQGQAPHSIELAAGQQVRVMAAQWPAVPEAVNAENVTAWQHRQIVCEHQPLEQVVTELNRYSSRPIALATPALRSMRISGIFAVDDTDTFVAFLRSLKGVRVEASQTEIRVFMDR